MSQQTFDNKTEDEFVKLLNLTDDEIKEDLEKMFAEDNKPTIEGVVLEGDKTFEDLNLVPLSNADLARILD